MYSQRVTREPRVPDKLVEILVRDAFVVPPFSFPQATLAPLGPVTTFCRRDRRGVKRDGKKIRFLAGIVGIYVSFTSHCSLHDC